MKKKLVFYLNFSLITYLDSPYVSQGEISIQLSFLVIIYVVLKFHPQPIVKIFQFNQLSRNLFHIIQADHRLHYFLNKRAFICKILITCVIVIGRNIKDKI